MSFDLLSTIELTASAAIVLAGLALIFGRGRGEQAAIAAALAAWFIGVVAVGASGLLSFETGIGVQGLPVFVFLPVALLTFLALATRRGRERVRAAPLPALIALQAVRVLGISFVMLYAAGRLPAPFAPVAGWGDVTIGLLAIPVAWLAWRRGAASRPAVLAWNALGLLDLATAVALGATSSPGPVRIFFEAPGSAMMTTLPWIIIPCFLVPALAALHLVTLSRLRSARSGGPASGHAALA